MIIFICWGLLQHWFYYIDLVTKNKNKMTKVSDLKNHLIECEKILEQFIKKYSINKYYLRIDDVVTINVHKSLNLIVLNEWNDFTHKEVGNILAKLYESFREYIEKNNLEYPLHIKSVWGLEKIVFKFEITN